MKNLIYTPTVRYNLLDEVDNLLNGRFDDLSRITRAKQSVFKENDEDYKAYFQLPGVKKEAISLKVVEDGIQLVAKSEEKAPFPVNVDQVYSLPEDADSENISAKLADGILLVTVQKAKAEEVPERVIEIS